MAIRPPKVDSKEHEKEILGMALVDVESANAVAKIPSDLFYYSRYRSIHHGVKKLVAEKKTVDMLALSAVLGDEFLVSIAEIGQHGINPDTFRQRVDELRDIRFSHHVANLSPKTTMEELEELLKKYKPSSEEDVSYIPDGKKTLGKVKHYSKHGGLTTHSTGWVKIDEHYTIAKKQLTVVTGIPGHGKSTWVDNLLTNLARKYNWKFCVFAPETYPVEQHYGRLIEIYTGKTMVKNQRPTKVKRLSDEEIEEAFEFLFEHVKILYIPPEERTIDNIMSQVGDDYDGFVLDPWNEIEHLRDKSLTETEYIGQTLMKLKAHAIWKDMHVWVVAHPKKLIKDGGDYKPPDPYDISGSANWYNKADMALTIHRKNGAEGWGEIHVKKVKVRGTGKVGVANLCFDWETQRFFEPTQEF